MKRKIALLLAGCLLAMTLPMSTVADEAPETKPALTADAAEDAADVKEAEPKDVTSEKEEEKELTSYTAAGITMTLPTGFVHIEEDMYGTLELDGTEDGNDAILIRSVPLTELSAMAEEMKEADKAEATDQKEEAGKAEATDQKEEAGKEEKADQKEEQPQDTEALFDLAEEFMFEELLNEMEKAFEVKGFTVNGLSGRYVSYKMADEFFTAEMDLCMFLNGEEILYVIREKVELDLSSLESLEEGEEGDEPLAGEEEITVPDASELPAAPENMPAEEPVPEKKPIDMGRAFMSIVLSACVAK